MKRVKINALLNIVMVLVFAPCAYSAFVLYFVLGRMLEFNATHLGLKRALWYDIHAWTGWILIVFLLIHLALHIRYFFVLPKIFSGKDKK